MTGHDSETAGSHLQRQLVRTLALASVLALLFVLACALVWEAAGFDKSQEQQSQRLAALLEEGVRPALAYEDPEAALRFLNPMRAFPSIESVVLYDRYGHPLASYIKENSRWAAPPRGAYEAPSVEQGVFHYWHTIREQNQLHGLLFIRLASPPLTTRIQGHAFMLGGVVLALGAVSLILHLGLRRLILGPLSELLRFCDEVSSSGDTSKRSTLPPEGDLGKLALAFNEVMERMEAHERSLKKSNAQIRSIFNASTEVMIMATDPAGTITLFSRGAERKLGLSAAEVVGIKTPLAWHPEEEIAERCAELSRSLGRPVRGFDLFKELAEHPKQAPLEWTLRPANGKLLRVHLVIGAIRDVNQTLTGYVGVATDVTSQLELESNLRQAQKMEAVGQLAGGIAHDFNNILAAMLLNLGMLHHKTLDPETEETLRELEREAHRAASLTRQLLMFSRRSMMQLKQVDLSQCISGMGKLLRRIIGEQVRLELSLPRRPVPVQADAGMIEQVVVNLSVNARDAMGAGGVLSIVLTSVELPSPPPGNNPAARPGHFARLSVTDNGSGMDAKTLARIFEPFFTTKEVGKGTGLGLATVDGIIRQHNGWIDVSSTQGRGSTFTLYLPLVANAQPETEKAGDTPSLPPKASGTILLVEDEQSVRHVTGIFLRRRGYEVIETANGREALREWKARMNEIDLLYTDMVLPDGMTGMDLLLRLRGDKPALRVILSSGYSTELPPSIKAMGGVVFLHKPCEIQLIAQAVHDCLAQPLAE